MSDLGMCEARGCICQAVAFNDDGEALCDVCLAEWASENEEPDPDILRDDRDERRRLEKEAGRAALQEATDGE